MHTTGTHFRRLVSLEASRDIHYEDLHLAFEEAIRSTETLLAEEKLTGALSVLFTKEDRDGRLFHLLVEPVPHVITAYIQISFR